MTDSPRPRTGRLLARALLITCLLALANPATAAHAAPRTAPPPSPTTPIDHFVFLMQENHTFDNYFGTRPGVDGIPADTCMPVRRGQAEPCVKPFHLGELGSLDLDHTAEAFRAQYNKGRMDGFVEGVSTQGKDGKLAMAYYDDRDLPYYWNVADEYVLFDRFFSSSNSGSIRNHMFRVTGGPGASGASESIPQEGWGDIPTIFDRLEAAGISWKFYVENYDPTITFRSRTSEEDIDRGAQVIWVPLLAYARYVDDPTAVRQIVDLDEYYEDAAKGQLPAVSFIAPAGDSEHPPGSIRAGQNLVRTLLTQLMRSPNWDSSAFLWSYDDWGGWYDHVPPPTGRQVRLRLPRAGSAGQPVRQTRARRLHDPGLHLGAEVHRGQLATETPGRTGQQGADVPQRLRLHRRTAVGRPSSAPNARPRSWSDRTRSGVHLVRGHRQPRGGAGRRRGASAAAMDVTRRIARRSSCRWSRPCWRWSCYPPPHMRGPRRRSRDAAPADGAPAARRASCRWTARWRGPMPRAGSTSPSATSPTWAGASSCRRRRISSDRKVVFDRFRGNVDTGVRGKVVELGVRTARLVSWSFIDRFGNTVPADRVTAMRLRSNTGEIHDLSGAELARPLWVSESRTQQGPQGLVSKQLYYVVDSAMVDGTSVVNRAGQRFVPWEQQAWVVQLLFFRSRSRRPTCSSPGRSATASSSPAPTAASSGCRSAGTARRWCPTCRGARTRSPSSAAACRSDARSASARTRWCRSP